MTKRFGRLIGALAVWSGRRPVWALLGVSALGIEIFSYVFFQIFLRLRPCELCVYIRFSMAVIFIGSALVALKPQGALFRLGGGLIIFWGLIQGLGWDIKLAEIYEAASGWALCSMTEVRFPFGLPLERWLPGHFQPTALCGEDKWSLWGLNMAEWLRPVYAFYFAAYGALFGSRFFRAART